MPATVFFVDDENSVLTSLKWLFSEEPYQVYTFSSPIEALEQMKQMDVAAIVADQRMPLMAGTVFLEKVKEQWPDTVRIIMTAHSDFKTAVDAINQGNVYRFIYKPWDEMELKMTVKNAVSFYELRTENTELFELTKDQNAQLQDLNQNLEKIVGLRTKELRQTNERLKREIEDRIKAEYERQKTFEGLQRALRSAIQAMALTLESRDPYTAGHQQRVSDLAQRIAGEMGLGHEMIEGIHMAGLIHDLGKIAVPAEILAKPTQLSDTELSIIKTHPELGYDILKDIEFPWPVARIVHQHHEKVNGSGYPTGLAGEDILMEARIMCVADVIEAMAFHRPYRPAFGIEDALAEIAHNRGVLYDSDVVDACLKLFKEKGFEFDET